MKKRDLLILTLLLFTLSLGAIGQTETETQTVSDGLLPIPPLLEGKNLELVMQEGSLELPMGTSSTMGFNGNFLGPTIRVSDKDDLAFTIRNTLNEDSTVHWHGLHVPAEFDGGPHQVIEAGETWKPAFTIDQKAATLWYHPHLMGKTAEHVYNGLAGLFYIEDEYSKSLDIPMNYGVNDIPLVLQDRRLNKQGQFSYNPGNPDLMHGYIGNIMLVNGAYQPRLEVQKGTYRFRVLNGSNSSILRISFSDKRFFSVIASDGGFLPKTVKTSSLILSTGERFEILVDFEETGNLTMITEIYGGDSFESFSIEVQDQEGITYTHPDGFDYEPVSYDPSDSIQRNFRMETRGMGGFTINGMKMALDRIDFSLNKNSTEVWTIENIGMGMMQIPHSFHVHDVQFSIISINGSPPGPLYSGPKDTILLMPGDKIVIALRFEEYTGIYMYHCHFLEHEDLGMMGQFIVE